MSAGNSVLFDAPGLKALRRQRTFSIAAAVVILLALGGLLYRMGTTGQLSYSIWEFAVTPRYIQAIAMGTLATIGAAVGAVLLAGVFGLIFGIGKMADNRPVRWFSWLVVEFFRAVPLLVLLLFIFIAYGKSIGSYASLVLALTLYNGAVLAEILRAGVNSVPKGQVEAAYAIGMRKSQVLRQVQLPQAVKIMLPALISQFVVALKDTSLGYVILAANVSTVGRQIITEFQNELPVGLILAAIYIVLNLALSKGLTSAQERLVGEQDESADGDADAQAQTGANAGG